MGCDGDRPGQGCVSRSALHHPPQRLTAAPQITFSRNTRGQPSEPPASYLENAQKLVLPTCRELKWLHREWRQATPHQPHGDTKAWPEVQLEPRGKRGWERKTGSRSGKAGPKGEGIY